MSNVHLHMTSTNPTLADQASPETPDALISQSRALTYWNSIPASEPGMLGGFEYISGMDLESSSVFLKKLRISSAASTEQPFARAVDCGAGIGRVSAGVLLQQCSTIDIVEPVEKFTSASTKISTLRSHNKLGDIYNVGLESFHPIHRYDLIWNQWCLGHLNDVQLVAHFRRCRAALQSGGWIVVKENMVNDLQCEDIFDEVDSSVTRTEAKWNLLFRAANLKIVATELQEGFPEELFPVRTWALQPDDS
jgi:protein N-terminal methyltransferase